MASLHRRPKSKYWHAGWYGADGKFRMRSTRQTDQKKARILALEWERAERLAKEGILTEVQAREVLNTILERTGAVKRLEEQSVRQWLLFYLSKKSDGTRERYGKAINGFIEALQERADRPLLAITGADVQAYIDSMIESGRSLSTAEVHLTAISGAFRDAVRFGHLKVNPAAAARLPKPDDDAEDVERETFTAAEVGMLVDAAEGEWKLIVLMGYYTGLRLMKCACIKWDQIDLLNDRIDAKPGKGGRKVRIPIHPELRKALEAAASTDTTDAYVFPELSSRDSGGKRGLSRDFLLLAKSAGVDLRPVTLPNGRTQNRRSFHSLRHSFVSALANADISHRGSPQADGAW
jgi:integrase